ncbi:hypothetical protein BCR33DRAFT_544000 [Rhizoclosmatium globosum]|uniref:Uncharacterized protein n=1 Tax=Rhizoclosmatium globosum TaxID=329046 RepID=A0A1Y2BAL3_9FUNG|nr:hypothetical protein BCR33DRAFT_544000 [Rhizoclosmatium globosum]|eukprot:ORY31517.1 hypothetical protein BCR33DRAFT_544000 [Rhizoclosmatium globosum]
MELILDFPDLGLSFSELSTELKQYNLNRLNTFHQALLMEQGFTLTETQQTFPPLRLSLRQQPSKNANRLAVLNKVLERVDPTNQWLPQNQIEVSEESSDADVVGVDEQNGDENGEGLQQQYEDGYINNGVDEAGENVEYVDETTYYEEQQQEYPSGDTNMQEYQSQEYPADSSVQEQFENGEYAQLDVNPSGGQEIEVEYVDPTTCEVYENGEGYEYTQWRRKKIFEEKRGNL